MCLVSTLIIIDYIRIDLDIIQPNKHVPNQNIVKDSIYLNKYLESDEVILKVRNDQRGGNASGVRSTPAVFINGRLLASPSRARILEVVNEELEDGSKRGTE